MILNASIVTAPSSIRVTSMSPYIMRGRRASIYRKYRKTEVLNNLRAATLDNDNTCFVSSNSLLPKSVVIDDSVDIKFGDIYRTLKREDLKHRSKTEQIDKLIPLFNLQNYIF